MSKIGSVFSEIVRIKDELKLQLHLLEMESKDEWKTLCDKLRQLEKSFEQDVTRLSEQIGQAEEDFYVGNKQEIQQLLNDFKKLKKQTDSKS
ncbi:hypothetical protein [Planctobacterium marinum]|uniref:Uncharacterized protein n=1 Tax=Planctobacterium marinum TaxID=1631968 RepID=A0AA48HWY5_9ALTE|nr:hypothetical protein MACH26_29140 [Planctobacterium marinum]